MSKVFGIEIGRKPAAPAPLPPWRADFLRKEDLPDTKVVRTHFLVNYGSAALALGLVAYAVWCEAQYADLRAEIGLLAKDNAANTAANNAALSQSGLYSEYSKSVSEFEKFKTIPLDCGRALAEIGAIRGDGMTFKTVSVDAAYFNPITKKEEIRIAVTGVQQLENGGKSFVTVSESYGKFRELNIWKHVKGRNPVSLPTPNKAEPNLLTHTIEFSFELSLTEGVK